MLYSLWITYVIYNHVKYFIINKYLLFLIFIIFNIYLYLINEYRVMIKFIGQKYFAKKIIKLL
jgi:hypothetical protein